MNHLTQDQKDTLQEIIQTEMLKRGFTAPITSFEEVEGRRGGSYIEFTTEPFQTTPVIFKEIRVGNFSTSISKEEMEREDKTKYTVIRFWIGVSARYTNFSGGTNGADLFQITGAFFEGEARALELQIQ